MLFPRFTVRTILFVTTLCALLFLVIGVAYRGQHWAWGLAIGVMSLAVAAIVHAACFGLVWCFAYLSPQKMGAAPRDRAPPAQEDAT